MTIANDKTAIEQIVQQMEDAWNTGDGDAFATHFSEEADFTVWNGMHQQGRKAIAAGHNHILSTIYKGTQNKYEIAWLRFLRPDVAVAQINGGLVVGPNNAMKQMLMRNEWPQVRPVMVLNKQADHWQIDVFQNTPIMPPPSANTGE